MGQQHRVRTKRKRRKAYLKRKREALRVSRREQVKSRSKKPTSAAE